MIMLRSSSPFLPVLALAVACGAPLPPSDETSETTEAADSSTGAVDSGSVSVSATSTTGRPPATSGTTLESTTTSDGSSEDTACSAVPGAVCRPFSAPPPAGYEHVGVCGLPPA